MCAIVTLSLKATYLLTYYVTGHGHVHLQPVVAAAESASAVVVGVDSVVAREADDSSRRLQRNSHREKLL